ncbi:polysaccharide pyruvyl transferase family protein [Mycolicibacterium baixiangningiae]|uniref:polysaccharide pyruvyl transferase family protein n=1 Tax=Mycolicibacterium baixiangningiae TaxID=2761578 RepID=UPI00186618A7|nr:polysaccharide pyruvyl transferase family protein [Mycolicibacterium baixiangningiae]
MIVEIRGTNTVNKGAQLMLQAICARLGGRYPLSVPPLMTDYTVRSHLGLRQTLADPMVPRMTAVLGNAVPRPVKKGLGLTSDREIGGVLDASGFHYSDQFPVAFPRRSAMAGRAWARRGIPKVILPQAFGPFEKSATRRWTREALGQAALIFVRDGVSQNHVRGLGLGVRTLRSPDFTIGLRPADVAPISEQPFLAIVPNTKMFTSGSLDRAGYVDALAGFHSAASANGLASVIVVHEATDHDVAGELARRTGAQLFTSGDPLVLKAVLGQASAAVASRFHAVVGCVSQSVPTLAFGWSHKYRELLDDFEVSDRLVTPDSDPFAAINRLLADASGDSRQKDRLPALVEQVEQMWDQTIEVLDAGAAPPPATERTAS